MVSLSIYLTIIVLFYLLNTSASCKFNNLYRSTSNQKWQANIHHMENGIKKNTYTDCHENEVRAAKDLNKLCINFGMCQKNLEIDGKPIPGHAMQSVCMNPVSNGFSWCKQENKWEVRFVVYGKRIYGGRFVSIFEAKKCVNTILEKNDLPHKYPGIGSILNTENKKQFVGVFWNKTKQKWNAILWHGGMAVYGGYFSTKTDAAKRINQLCEKNNIPHKNPGIGNDPKEEEHQRRSKLVDNYKGISWCKGREKYVVQLYINKKNINGGGFTNILDAAKRVNEICDENDLPRIYPHLEEHIKDIQEEQQINVEFDENKNINTIMKRKRKHMNYKRNKNINKNYFSSNLLAKEKKFQYVVNSLKQ